MCPGEGWVRALHFLDIQPDLAKSYGKILFDSHTVVLLDFANYIWLGVAEQATDESSREIVERRMRCRYRLQRTWRIRVKN